MSGMGDGYVGTSQDAVRIRRLEKQREAERQKIQELKTKSASDKGQPGLLQFGSSTSEVGFLRLLLSLVSLTFRNLGFQSLFFCFTECLDGEKLEENVKREMLYSYLLVGFIIQCVILFFNIFAGHEIVYYSIRMMARCELVSIDCLDCLAIELFSCMCKFRFLRPRLRRKLSVWLQGSNMLRR